MEMDEVITRVKNGENHYFAHIINYYEQKVFTTVIRIIRNHAAAEDIVQDIFIKVFYSLHKYEKTGSFNAWLYRIVVNYCFDYLRKHKHQTIEIESEITDSRYPEKILLLRERNEELEQLLQQLDKADYMVLLLKYVNGLSYDEISEVLQITLNDVRNKLHRSKRKLRSIAMTKGGYFNEM
ncbi:RNA polymerase sigma factor [Solibacillus sp. FSL K6-1523]|uniref:RNA polymerase sigma factor n=1 Tax=Solibacillus sp. FSL K6-1523 TaxID=2921471 RepID=UPI0030F7F3D5